MKQGFSLLELLVVIVIIGVLSTIGLSHYGAMKERTLDKEAAANLKLMQAAEKVYHLETGTYYTSTDTTAINQELKLSLPVTSPDWQYRAMAGGCVEAVRSSSDGRSWNLPISQEEPVNGSCTSSSTAP